MDYQRLGASDLTISPLGLGCSRIGSVTQQGGDQAAFRLIGKALDLGINFFDTADIYGQGRSEELLAKATRSHQEQVVIATKAGYCGSKLGGIVRHIKPVLRFFLKARPTLRGPIQQIRATQSRQDFSQQHLVRSAEASLRRLKRDALDLFYLHSPPTELLVRGEVFQFLEQLKTAGKIRYYGVACLTTADALVCLQHRGVTVVQVEANFLTPDVFQTLLPQAGVSGIGVVLRQTLAGGLALRAPAALRPEDCSGRAIAFSLIQARLAALHEMAARSGIAMPGLMLRYLLGRPAVSSNLIGTTNSEHLAEQIEAGQAGMLPPDLVTQLDRIMTTSLDHPQP